MTIDLDVIRARMDALKDLPGGDLALADEVPGLIAEVEFLQAREEHFAAALGVADGGQYRNDWDGALRRLVAERDRLQAELDAAEGKVLPARWTIHEGVWVRTVAHRTDLEITVHRGASSGPIPFARIVTYHVAGNVVKRIEAKTILAAIEAAEKWLKENLE